MQIGESIPLEYFRDSNILKLEKLIFDGRGGTVGGVCSRESVFLRNLTPELVLPNSLELISILGIVTLSSRLLEGPRLHPSDCIPDSPVRLESQGELCFSVGVDEGYLMHGFITRAESGVVCLRLRGTSSIVCGTIVVTTSFIATFLGVGGVRGGGEVEGRRGGFSVEGEAEDMEAGGGGTGGGEGLELLSEPHRTSLEASSAFLFSKSSAKLTCLLRGGFGTTFV